MTDIRVLIAGSGRMGTEMLGGIAATSGLQPVGVLEKFAQGTALPLPGGGSVPLSADANGIIAATRPDVMVDFSHHEWTQQIAPVAVRAGVRPVIGTTGLTEHFVQQLGDQCDEHRIGGVIAANFAVGAVLMMHFAAVAAPFFEVAEIIELHHDRKIDAPSGTALATARGMAAAHGHNFTTPPTEKETVPGTRGGQQQGITIHSVRLPGLVAHQEVLFGGQGQTLTIRHDSTSRDSFLPGVILAVHAVMQRPGLVIGLERLMGLA